MKKLLLLALLASATVSFAQSVPDIQNYGALSTANQAVVLVGLNQRASGLIQLAGTWTGSIVIECTLDGFTSTATLYTAVDGSAPTNSALTSNGFYRILGVSACDQIRARFSVATSGTVNVVMRASAGAGQQVTQSLNSNQSVNLAQVGGTAVVANPCQALQPIPFSKSGTASVVLVAGTSAKKTYICSIKVVVAAAQNVAVVEGTGSTCGTNTVAYPGITGGTTAATGDNLAANGGFVYGTGGFLIAIASVNADDVCALLANAVQTNISGTFVQQ